MNWTFGIITAGGEEKRIYKILESIWRQRGLCPGNYEIVIVGGDNVWDSSIIYIPFDESIKKAWISKKKNLVVQNAKHNNICLMHDYVALEPNWYLGFEKFGDDWLTCTNRVENLDGIRFRDWCVIGNDSWHDFNDNRRPFFEEPGRYLSYDIKVTDEIARWLYLNGAYYCIKRKVALEVPLNENRCWGQGEDVLASRELYFKYGKDVFNFNPYSSVKFLKQKPNVPWQKLSELEGSDIV